jgi:heptosyltransferase II
MKILIVAPSWIGDAVLSQPLLAQLAACHPAATFDVLAPRWVLPVYRRMAQVADTIESPFGHGELRFFARWQLARRLRSRSYDVAFILPNSLKSALIPFLARIPRRTGFVGEWRYGLLTDPRPLDERRTPLMVDRFSSLALPAESEPSAARRPVLTVRQAEGEALLAKLGFARPTRLVCFCPGAEYGPAKRWPANYFAELALALSREGWAIWLLGSQKDGEVGAEIGRQAGPAVRDLTGKTTLDEAIVLLSAADLVISNDSGLMHVAAALDRPLIAIFGSSSPQFTPPLSQHARVVQLPVPCSPCFQRVCPLGHFDCMMRLTAPRIREEIGALLGR